MSYTAAALSFMFENLSKPIVLTGSQVCEMKFYLGVINQKLLFDL